MRQRQSLSRKSDVPKIRTTFRCIGALVVFFAAGAIYAEAVLSDIGIQAGNRGVALSLGADGPFEAQFTSKVDKSTGAPRITIRLLGIVYGLKEYAFGGFPTGAPVESIAIREIKGSPNLEIMLQMRAGIPMQSIQAIRKSNGWVALLSRNPSSEYQWAAPIHVPAQTTASAEPSAIEASTGSTSSSSSSSPPLQQARVSPQTAAQPQDDVKYAKLTNVIVIQRSEVSQFVLEFDSPVECAVRCNQNSLSAVFSNASNATGSARYVVAPGSPYQAVRFEERVKTGNRWLTVHITLDSSVSGEPRAISINQGRSHALFIVRRAKVLGVWDAVSGQSWTHEFVTVPSYDPELQSIEKKALRDASEQVADGATFAVGSQQSAVEQPVAQAPIAESTPPPEPVPAGPASSTVPEPQIVISDNVNLRENAASDASSPVIARLAIGQQFRCVERRGAWVRIQNNETSGWVHSRFVLDSSKVSAAQWLAIGAKVAAAQVAAATSAPAETVAKSEPGTEAAPEEPAQPVSDTLKAPALTEGSVIRYRVYGRDPFIPLDKDSIAAGGIPKVEHLKLVGVLYDNSDRIALLEDFKNDNRAYALREDDPVESGRLLRVYRDNVVFLISEFGISRSYTLRLARNTQTK